MTGDRAATALFLVLALTLPLSALVARRLSLGRTTRLALIWLAIFVLAAVIVQFEGWASPPRPASHTLHNIYYQTGR